MKTEKEEGKEWKNQHLTEGCIKTLTKEAIAQHTDFKNLAQDILEAAANKAAIKFEKSAKKEDKKAKNLELTTKCIIELSKKAVDQRTDFKNYAQYILESAAKELASGKKKKPVAV